MEFCGILKLDSKGRTDVSMFFEVGAKLFFAYDSDEDVFIARRLFGTESVKPQWAKIGEAVTVKKSGFVTIPEWVLEISPGTVKMMMISPVYSEAQKAISALYMRPICQLELASSRADDKEATAKLLREVNNCLRTSAETKDLSDLSGQILQTAFGKDFDTKAGREDTPLSANAFVDDF